MKTLVLFAVIGAALTNAQAKQASAPAPSVYYGCVSYQRLSTVTLLVNCQDHNNSRLSVKLAYVESRPKGDPESENVVQFANTTPRALIVRPLKEENGWTVAIVSEAEGNWQFKDMSITLLERGIAILDKGSKPPQLYTKAAERGEGVRRVRLMKREPTLIMPK